MAYFIHNRYDSASITALAGIDTSANTVIDYYGDYETNKYLDTSGGFGVLQDTIAYITPTTLLYSGQTDVDAGFSSVGSYSKTSAIKNITFGTASNSSSPYTVTVSLGEINPAKTFIILQSHTASSTVYNAYVSAISSTGFTVCCRQGVSYFAVEFN